MAGVWLIVLLGGAWIAPGFASGGDEEEDDVRDQDATTPRQVTARYVEAGLDGDSDRSDAALCDDASPAVTEGDLVAVREDYQDVLGSYPEVEVQTSEPVGSSEGMEITATVSFIGDTIYKEQFGITVLQDGDSYCVSDAVQSGPDESETGSPGEPGHEIDPQELSAKYLSAIFVTRDLQGAEGYMCADYKGPDPGEVTAALETWESRFGDATAVQEFEGAPDGSGDETTVPMSVDLSSNQSDEAFTFEVSVIGDCVSALSGGEALLESA